MWHHLVTFYFNEVYTFTEFRVSGIRKVCSKYIHTNWNIEVKGIEYIFYKLFREKKNRHKICNRNASSSPELDKFTSFVRVGR